MWRRLLRHLRSPFQCCWLHHKALPVTRIRLRGREYVGRSIANFRPSVRAYSYVPTAVATVRPEINRSLGSDRRPDL